MIRGSELEGDSTLNGSAGEIKYNYGCWKRLQKLYLDRITVNYKGNKTIFILYWQ